MYIVKINAVNIRNKKYEFTFWYGKKDRIDRTFFLVSKYGGSIKHEKYFVNKWKLINVKFSEKICLGVDLLKEI